MKGSILFIILQLLLLNISYSQTLKVSCTEKDIKIKDRIDPIIIKTCHLKNYKFVETASPDYKGRYSDSNNSVYVLIKGSYKKITNAEIFNDKQGELLAIINEQNQRDFTKERADTTDDCLSNLDSIPKYKMNDFQISFQKKEIWFYVSWGLGGACMAADGTIVSFKVSEIEKYLR